MLFNVYGLEALRVYGLKIIRAKVNIHPHFRGGTAFDCCLLLTPK